MQDPLLDVLGEVPVQIVEGQDLGGGKPHLTNGHRVPELEKARPEPGFPLVNAHRHLNRAPVRF